MANLHTAQQLIEDGNREAATEILNAALRENPTDYVAMNMLWGLRNLANPSNTFETLRDAGYDYSPDCELADPGATYISANTPYWPNGDTYPFTSIPQRRFVQQQLRQSGLAALESRMKSYGMIEPYDQAEVDRRASSQLTWTMLNDAWEAKFGIKAIARRERRNKIIRRSLIVVGFIGYVSAILAIDSLMGWETGTTLVITTLGAISLAVIGVLVLWIVSD